MIFICVGLKNYPFNRLFQKLDELVEKNEIQDEITAQIGQSTYIPKHIKYQRYFEEEEFKKIQKRADLIISHGGTRSLVDFLRLGKQVIAVPRMEKYGEHIDNHQTQIAGFLAREGYLKCISDIEELGETIYSFRKEPITKIYDKPSIVIEILSDWYCNYYNKENLGKI